MPRRSSGVRLLPLVLGVALALFAGAPTTVPAQDWRGPVALEVVVEDVKGRDLAGAEVRLVYLDPEGGGTLPSVLTDAGGKATIGGLAAGRWIVEVRHSGQMTYRAELAISADDRPQVLSAAHEMAPGATGTMKVRINRGRAGAPPPAARVAASPVMTPAPPPAPPATPQPSQPAPATAPAPPAPVAPAPRPAEAPPAAATTPAQPPAAAAPAPPAVTAPPATVQVPAPKPAAPPVTNTTPPAPPPAAPAPAKPPAASPPAPQPTPRPAAPAPAVPPAPTASPATSAPAPRPPATPPSSPPATPPVAPPAATPQATAPVVATPAPPVAPVAATSPAATAAAPPAAAVPASPAPAPVPARQRVCVECAPGEKAQWGEASISGGATAGCPPDLRERLEGVALPGGLETLSAEIGAGCRAIRVDLPAGTRFTGFRYEASSPGVVADCLPGRDCPAGAARFPFEPVIRKENGRTTLLVGFESTAADWRNALVAGYWAQARK